MGIYDDQMTVKDKLMSARCRLITLEAWYGTMASLFEWRREDRVKTMGVRIIGGGVVECLYNEEFCEGLSVEQLLGVVKHEIEHVVRLHCVRGLGAGRDQELFNIACDAVINGRRDSPNINDLPGKWIAYPSDFPPNLTAEEVYDKFDKEGANYNGSCSKCGGSGKQQSGQGQGQGQQGQGQGQQQQQQQGQNGQGQQGQNGQGGKGQNCPQCNGKGSCKRQMGGGKGSAKHQIDGEVLDDHDIWQGSTVSEDEARQVVKDMVNQAAIKAGNTPGHLQEAIKALEDPKINWKYELRQFVGRQVGSKRGTWARQNRRRQAFGVKGVSHHASTPVTVMVDTSGSVSEKMLRQFFSEFEMMSQRFKVTLMQFDHGYQCHSKYRRGDWRKLKVQGRGGTSFIEAFKHLEEKKLVGAINVVCTDGEAPWPEPRPYPTLWVIMRHAAHEFTPPFGTVIYLDGFSKSEDKKKRK